MQPIKTEYIKLTKSDVTKNRLLIGIDSGNSLTKVIFLNKNNKEEFLNDNVTTLTLEFSLFSNKDFENAMQFIKLNALQLDDNDYDVHFTGVFARQNRDKIKSILNKNVIFIDELETISKGYQIVLEQIGLKNMLAKDVEVKGYGEMDSEMIDRLMKSINSKFQDEENSVNEKSSPYPCLFCIHGSCSAFLYFDANGKPEYIAINMYGGKSFLGLAKCLLDTNDYNEVVALASRGDRSKIDTLVKEMLDGNIDSPYGKFPPYLPIFSFGKCADYNKGLSDFCKEDIALSLVSFHAMDLFIYCIAICTLKKISKVYLNGNLFNSDVFQKEIYKMLLTYPTRLISPIFLNFGYFGALGAMFCDEVSSKNPMDPQ